MAYNKEKKLIIKFLFYYTTYLYLFISLLTAHLPNIGIMLTIARDLWMFVSLYLITKYSTYTTITILYFTLAIGFISFVFSDKTSSILVFAYGVRDILFLTTVFCLSSLQICEVIFLKKPALIFILVIATLALISLVLQITDNKILHEAIFATSQYYAAKGITTNTYGGVFGARLLEPLYSASLVGTLLCGYAVFNRGFRVTSLYSLFIAIFTVAKVIPVLLYFRLLRRTPFLASVGILSALFLIYEIVTFILDNQPTSIYTFHAASVLDRFNIFRNFPNLIDLFLLTPLGYNSVAGHVMNGLDPSVAPESLVISKIYDLGIYFSPFIGWMLGYIYCCEKNIRAFLCAFLFIQVFSSLSNHLVAIFPLIILIICNQQKNESRG